MLRYQCTWKHRTAVHLLLSDVPAHRLHYQILHPVLRLRHQTRCCRHRRPPSAFQPRTHRTTAVRRRGPRHAFWTCSPVLSTACVSHMWLYAPHKSVPLIKPFWPNYSTRRSDSKYSLRFSNNMFLNNSYRVPPMNITLGFSYSTHIRIHLHQ